MAESRAWLSRLAPAGGSPFVGRDRELGALEALLDKAGQGSGRVALIAGEPGIGKTRVLAEVAERAAARGWLVLSGRAYESEGMPPYLPFTEALGQYMKVCSPADLRTQLGRGAAEVALLLPQLLEHVPGLEPSPPVSQDEQYRLFEGVAGFLLNIASASKTGLLLCLEDLHWADGATLSLLEHLGRRLPDAPLLVLATCRTAAADRSQAFTEVVSGLQRARLCEQVDVPPLSAQEAGCLVQHLAGSAPAPAVVEAVHHETGGNPFFLEEVVRHLQAGGRDLAGEHAVAGMSIPETVRQAIGLRLARLRPESVHALQVASALGDPFSFDALAAAAGTPIEPLLDALDEASAHGFVREDGSGGYHFNHALVRETVYAAQSGPRRALLHAQVAQGLEPLYQGNVPAHAGELAHHFLLGDRRGDLTKAMGYALQAADHAMTQLAFDDAIRYYQIAIDAHQNSDEHDEARRCEMLLALATATFKAGDLDRGDEINLLVAAAAKAAGLQGLLARACLASAAYYVRPNAAVIPLLEDTLAAIPAADSSHRSGALSLLACQRAIAGSWETQAPIREESIAMARRLGDGRALAFALRNAYIGNRTRLQERRAAVEEVVQLARELGDKELEVTSQCDYLTTSLLLGDSAVIDEGIAAHIRLGDELHQRMQMAHGLMLRAMRALLSGPLSCAEELNGELQRFGHRFSIPWAAPHIDLHTLLLRWEQGRLAELAQAFRDLRAREPSLLALALLAFISGELGDAVEERALVNEIDATRLSRVPDDDNRTFVLSLLAHTCAAIGEKARSEVLYTLLLPRAAYVVATDGGNACLGSTSRYLGLLATTLGRFDDAERHFDDSDAMNTRLGARPLLAHTKVDRARLHLARRARGDLARARQLLEEAAAAFDDLEIVYHAGQARSLLTAVLQGGTARPAYPDGLTSREVDVLRLIAKGCTSREIGEDLVLSVRTVERHIANIYLKTGTHSRVAAVTYASAHGLLTPGSSR